MIYYPAITLTVPGTKIELAGNAYTLKGNLINVPSLNKTFVVSSFPEIAAPKAKKKLPNWIERAIKRAEHHAKMAHYHRIEASKHYASIKFSNSPEKNSHHWDMHTKHADAHLKHARDYRTITGKAWRAPKVKLK